MKSGAKLRKVDTMVAGLGAEIVRGAIAPNTVLPPERDLETRFESAAASCARR